MSKRRWLRPKPRISYFEPEEPNLDEYVFCEKCSDFVYEYCSIHGALLVIPDDKVPAKHNFPSIVPRAALTIPKVFLHLNYSSIPGAGLGVFASLTLPKGVRFGPYRGLNTTELTSDYSWQIYDSAQRPRHVVDASDGDSSNWMRFVNCARRWPEQNLVAFQYQGQLYYRTIKIIPRFTELLVFYGSEFAKRLHIDLGKYNAPKSYAQKFGACVPMKPKMLSENKNTQDESKTKLVQPKTLKNTLPLDIPEKNNKRKIIENQKEARVIKKRKTKGENKKLQPQESSTVLVNKNSKNALENMKEHAITTREDAVRESNYKDTIINTEIEAPKPKGEEKQGNKLPKHITAKVNILNSSTAFTKLVGSVASSNNAYIKEVKIPANNEKQCVDINQRKEQNTDLINPEDVYFICNECNYQCITKDVLERHLRFHDVNRKFACETCRYRFNSSWHLNSHKLSHKTDEISAKMFKCNTVDFTTVEGSALENHLKMNNQEKPHACTICDYKSTCAGDLKQHLKTHTVEKPYSCDKCQFNSTQLSNLKTHLRIHTGEKPYSCDKCQFNSTQLGNLKAHLRIHTGEKPYSCDKCQFNSTTLGNLKRHLRIHTGEKPYSCDKCQFNSTQLGHLKAHLRIHTGEKPYSCDKCQFNSTTLGNLKRHLRIHTGEKPYSCDICAYKCSDKSCLKKHLMTKHLS